jgi:hypothetical protein
MPDQGCVRSNMTGARTGRGEDYPVPKDADASSAAPFPKPNTAGRLAYRARPPDASLSSSLSMHALSLPDADALNSFRTRRAAPLAVGQSQRKRAAPRGIADLS